MNLICRGICASPASPDYDYRTLVSTLCVHDRAREVLEDAAETIHPRNRRYKNKIIASYTMSTMSLNEKRLYPRHGLLRYDLYNMQMPCSVIQQLPEALLTSTLDSNSNIAREGYIHMITVDLHRCLGDWYDGTAWQSSGSDLNIQ